MSQTSQLEHLSTNNITQTFAADVEHVNITAIKINPKNARTHSKKQLDQISRSIKQFGFINPIIADEDNVILAGHGRLAAASSLGITKVPVIKITHLSELQKRALMLADNKIAENAGWDREALSIELASLTIDLPEVDLDIGITGFETGEIDVLIDDHSPKTQDDFPIPETTPNPVASRGDLWQLGKHRLACGDCRDQDLHDQLFQKKSATMVITDPPFNVRVQGHVGGRGKTKHEEFAFASGEMTSKEYRLFLNSTISNMAHYTCEGGLIYVFIDWRHVEDVLVIGAGLELILKNICIWNKTTPGQGSFYRSAHEMIVVFQKPGSSSINNVELGKFGRNRTNVWNYPGVNTFKTGKGDDLVLHPTVKPVNMIAEAIKDASNLGDIVFDPFLGSGTTLLAAEKVGRVCYAIEYEPKFVDVAILRWQKMTGKDAIHTSSGLTYDALIEQRSLETALLPDSTDAGELL